ncbi:MAG TPA: hypothetical protein VN889_06225 [Solirubrobacteraceae bacterium]|nr:hypothetical protein [Solirubrobacteraceae bacterium]
MTDSPDARRAATAISVEIGLDLSYFTDESERNFLPLALPIGYVLLQWFAEGVVTGAGEAAGAQAEREVAGAVEELGTRVRRLFGRHKTTPEADAAVEQEVAAEARAALTNGQQTLAAKGAEQVACVADAYEQALVGYLTDDGMPARDAVRIAQRVRAEAGIELRLSPAASPG